LDGIETPENMVRCAINHLTYTSFWRSWHGSLNKWTIRYLYVPLGGTKTQHLSIWLIFLFIALWHDLWWRWVAWAFFNCVFMTIERLFLSFFTSSRFSWFYETWSSGIIIHLILVVNGTLLSFSNFAVIHGFSNTCSYIFMYLTLDGGKCLLYSFCVSILPPLCVIENRKYKQRLGNKKSSLMN